MLQKEAIGPNILELIKTLQAEDVFSTFHLAGGTGLALLLGHRQSDDIDLFTGESFDEERYLQHLEANYRFSLDFRARSTLKGSINGIKTDIISHAYPLVKPLVTDENMRVYSREDIAAMKVNAIAGDGTRSKDFVDIYFLLKEFTVGNLIAFFETKYTQRSSFHALKSLCYFDEVDLADWPIMIKEKDLRWDKVKRVIETGCKEFTKQQMPI
jgi:hypothetical protein